MREREDQPPLTTKDLDFTQPLESNDFRPVKIRGHYMAVPPLRLGPRTFKGQAGQHIFQPFQSEDGRIFLIDRGWIPNTSQSKEEYTPQGTLTLIGILRGSSFHTWFTPLNQPAKNQWYSVKIKEMAMHLNLPLQPCYIALTIKDTAEGFPLPSSAHRSLPNRHLEYALTWYAFALIFGVIYGVMVWNGKLTQSASRPSAL